MKPRAFANLESLCVEAERLIRAQGKRPPGREVLREWLRQPAKAVTRAHRLAERAARLRAKADRVARDSAVSALESVALAVTAWCETAPPAGPYHVPFDLEKHAVRLVELPPCEPAGTARQVRDEGNPYG